VLQRRASFETRKGRCSTLNCCIILALNRFRFKELCSSRTDCVRGLFGGDRRRLDFLHVVVHQASSHRRSLGFGDVLGNGADRVKTGSLGGAGRRRRIGTATFGDIEADALQRFGRVEIAAPLPDGDGDVDAVGLRPRPADPKESKPSPSSSGASSAVPVDCCPHYVLSTDARANRELRRSAGRALFSGEMPGK
jgi:hypothetical protein